MEIPPKLMVAQIYARSISIGTAQQTALEPNPFASLTAETQRSTMENSVMTETTSILTDVLQIVH